MGYYITINTYDLEANGLRRLPKGIDTLWYLEDDKVEMKETFFKWHDWFENDLKSLAVAGVTGELTFYGEEGEWYKYKLYDSSTFCFNGSVEFESTPSKQI